MEGLPSLVNAATGGTPAAGRSTGAGVAVRVTAVGRSAVADVAGSMHGFPAALTSFVGRAAVVDAIAGQLGQYRLVTLTGPGGAGKTRLAAALSWWWQVRGRLAGKVPLLREAVDRAAAGSHAWCLGHTWLGQASLDSADPAGALRHFTAVRDAIGDRRPFPLLARCLSGRAATLLTTGRIAEAAGDARGALAAARESDSPVAEALALAVLGLVATVAEDRVGAVQLAQLAEQITAAGPARRPGRAATS